MKILHIACATIATTLLVGGSPSAFAQAKKGPATGTPVTVVLDKATCGRFDLGTISCGTEYVAVLSPDGKMWSVTGETKEGVKGVKGDYPHPGGSAINIWGRQLTRRGADVFLGDVKVGTAR